MRKKKYIETDVLTEAKSRINRYIDNFDNVWVSFSGGKDSLAVLNLVQEVYNERGIKEKVNVFFRDEELIPDSVISFVQKIHDSGKYNFRYYAFPQKSEKFILGKNYEYIQWDKNRRHLRQPPSYAICELGNPSDEILSQYTFEKYAFANEKGSVVILLGIRADESLLRMQVCMTSLDPSLAGKPSSTIRTARPIYDWTENDIFLYFYQRHIKYCDIYDMQMWNREALRVATPLHSEASKNFYKLKTRDPIFYEQLIELFPEMLLQSRYWKEFNRHAIMEKYPHTYDGIRQYIEDYITDDHYKNIALNIVASAEKQPHGYTVLHVFESILSGSYKRGNILPKKTTLADILYKKQQDEKRKSTNI